MATDNVLIAQIVTILNNGFAGLSSQIPTAPLVVQSYQPVQQGAVSAPTVYLYKIGDTRRGYPKFSYVWNPISQTEVETVTQKYETTFQLTCWATQNPANTTALTAADLANFAVYIMQTQETVAAFEANGIGIYRIGQIRNPVFQDDRDRYEFAPSFDFTLTHDQVITGTTPILTETVLQILDV